ncbi:hypothetical protein GMRT_jh019 [Giardia muris]|uniref:Uncharacterized protein n=1 Tax=Giardia muris TaxID=5742 RepID=A0A4Z1SX92_GIAMU|nr:hypothetical protein GMRT_jh019 [Giardia muris]|eukprot:TNJ26323.1 hypothetical protein GMRT_jh019 [Giardia muris]
MAGVTVTDPFAHTEELPLFPKLVRHPMMVLRLPLAGVSLLFCFATLLTLGVSLWFMRGYREADGERSSPSVRLSARMLLRLLGLLLVIISIGLHVSAFVALGRVPYDVVRTLIRTALGAGGVLLVLA